LKSLLSDSVEAEPALSLAEWACRLQEVPQPTRLPLQLFRRG